MSDRFTAIRQLPLVTFSDARSKYCRPAAIVIPLCTVAPRTVVSATTILIEYVPCVAHVLSCVTVALL